MAIDNTDRLQQLRRAGESEEGGIGGGLSGGEESAHRNQTSPPPPPAHAAPLSLGRGAGRRNHLEQCARALWFVDDGRQVRLVDVVVGWMGWRGMG